MEEDDELLWKFIVPLCRKLYHQLASQLTTQIGLSLDSQKGAAINFLFTLIETGI